MQIFPLVFLVKYFIHIYSEHQLINQENIFPIFQDLKSPFSKIDSSAIKQSFQFSSNEFFKEYFGTDDQTRSVACNEINDSLKVTDLKNMPHPEELPIPAHYCFAFTDENHSVKSSMCLYFFKTLLKCVNQKLHHCVVTV